MRRSNMLRGAAATALVFVAGGCSSVSSTVFPDTPSTPAVATPVASLPSAGTSVFAPISVAAGTPTGTPQGATIISLRARLVTVQGELSAHNATLSGIRQRAAADGAIYR